MEKNQEKFSVSTRKNSQLGYTSEILVSDPKRLQTRYDF